MSRFVHDQSRRAFLKSFCSLGMAGVAAPFLTSLGAIGEAAAATANDYKALVCVFLYGGMDYANTIVPCDAAGHGLYYAARRNIALEREALAATTLTPSVDIGGGRQYALAPSMIALKPLFDAGRMAVMLNVGTLTQPTTKAQFIAKSVRLPPRLFSHNDQQSFFMASNPEGAPSGWGGRIGDVFQNGNGAATLTCMNASGNAVFLSGCSALSYSVGTSGPVALLGGASTLYSSSAAQQALRVMMTAQTPNLLATDHAAISRRALNTYDQVTGALAKAPASAFPLFPASNSLAEQLKMVARMISVSADLGMRRQVFMVSMGGFDVHDNLATDHPVLMQRVSEAIRAFHDTTVALGVSEKVTTFTASDFGRTLVSNNDGSDHGWGSMHFAIGGAVNGRRFYGTPPEIGNGTNSDVGHGRLLPTMAVDQYAATFASWFGVSAGEMATVLPNIGNYDASTHNVGFLN